MWDRRLLGQSLNVRRRSRQPDVGSGEISMVRWHAPENEIHGEAGIEVGSVVNLVDIFLRQGDFEGFDVVFEMFDLALTDDGKDAGGFLHDVR